MLGMVSHESTWPGERDPSRHDVESANELPEPALLSDFKRALLSSPDASGNERLMHLELISRVPEQKRFTFPVALLSDFPPLPAEGDFVHLRQIFSKACLSHVFLGRLPLPPPSREPIAPPLRLGLACLASVHVRRNGDEARNLFLAGMSLWAVTMEVDNREARSLEMLTAGVLLGTYGALTKDETIRNRSALILCSSITIARRMRLHDPSQLGDLLGSRASSYRSVISAITAHLRFTNQIFMSSSLVWCLWLNDVLQALHLDLSLNFSSRELRTRMPSSPDEFQDVYGAILQEPISNTVQSLLSRETTSQEDAVLLLVALLSDSICLRRSLGRVVKMETCRDMDIHKHNPFVPLSPHTELDRMQNLLSTGLDRWHTSFHTFVAPEILALYHYCRLYLSCSELALLPRLAGYQTYTSPPSHPSLPNPTNDIRTSDQSMRQAWLVLDNAASRSRSSDGLCPVWLPIVVFHGALVIWAGISLGTVGDSDKYGSTRVLLAFKAELEGMAWPCCVEMVATLRRLMSRSNTES